MDRRKTYMLLNLNISEALKGRRMLMVESRTEKTGTSHKDDGKLQNSRTQQTVQFLKFVPSRLNKVRYPQHQYPPNASQNIVHHIGVTSNFWGFDVCLFCRVSDLHIFQC
jgi:hypothetical protein